MDAWQVWLVGLGAVQAMMVAVWVGSLVRTDTSLVDRFWGVAFVVLAWTYTLAADTTDDARAIVVPVLVTIWGLRLAGYITWRNWGDEEDPRYQARRRRRPDTFPVRSLVTVFLLQGALAWLISLPLLAVATRPVFGLTGAEITAATLLAALPVANNVFVIATRYGERPGRISGAIFASTCLALVSFNLWAWWMLQG